MIGTSVPTGLIAGLSQPAGNRQTAAQLWWGGWGSNPRPADYESAALTGAEASLTR